MFIRSAFGKILVQRICNGTPPGFKPIKDGPKKQNKTKQNTGSPVANQVL